MLHIVNGDSATETLKESGMAGEYLPFREVLTEGPTPQGLSEDQWFSTRARFLGEEYELEVEDCLKGLLDQQEAMLRFRDHEEVTLWFGPDLCCQIHLIYLLNWFAEQGSRETRLSLVCIGEYPGVPAFTCLGQLTSAQLAPLFDQRHEVTDQELELATRAWGTFRSSVPEEIVDLLNQDTSSLPYLRGALRRHLSRFPSIENGLGSIQNSVLKLVSEGHDEFRSLFPRIGKSDPALGLGDSQVWNDIKRMGEAKEPLVEIEMPDDLNDGNQQNSFHKAILTLTDEGNDVLAGKSDFIGVSGIDRWHGGAHLTESNLWRWDEQNQKLVREVLSQP